MQKGDTIRTPRFLTVEISTVLGRAEAWEQGFREPTHYCDDPAFDVYGKHTGTNRMIFAAVAKN
ncbi:MAG: hypothetical protein FWE98_04010 [Oscillospiraceae bacterium]|nr:hypothetical protein [Oscillospiraceae bacterium]